MRRKLAWVLVGVACVGMVRAEPVQVGFEGSEGYQAGSGELGSGWQKEESMVVEIDGEEKAGGSQSLKIEAGENEGGLIFSPKGIPEKGVRFIDVRMKPAAWPKDSAKSAASLFGSSVGFVADEKGSVGIVAVSGDTISMVESGLRSGEVGGTDRWVRLTIRQDVKAKKWDLFVDGRLSAIELKMEEEGQDELVIFDHEKAGVWVDEIEIGKVNPLFADGDQDGMPDAEEEAVGLNTYADNRLGDIDGDGISNIEEMLQSGSPVGAGSEGALASLIYVDNLNGSDANNGVRSYPVAGNGPKASIKTAMAQASDGAVIVIMPGKGVYDEGSRGVPGKRLTIKALSNVTIK